MFERFTVDILAEHVAAQLLEGVTTPKLSYRFFRKGRRDGKKAYDHASVAKLLTDAVHLAGSTLVEELASRRSEAELRIAEGHAAIDEYELLKASEVPPQPETREVPESIASTEPAGERPDSGRLLLDALATRKRLRVRREADAMASEARAQQRATATRLEAAEQRATEARADITRLERQLATLPAEYAQRFESIKHTGELLWSRYCNGFVQGEGRRGSRTSDVEAPTGTLRFETPLALRAHDSDAVAESKES